MLNERLQGGGSTSETEEVNEQESEPGDDYDEDDSENKYKRPQNEKYGGFILDVAEDDEIEYEDTNEAQEISIISRETNKHGPTAQERRTGTSLRSSQREDKIEVVRRKFTGECTGPRKFGDGSKHVSDKITQLPDVKYSNLWIVKCRNGEEKNAVLLLMRKFFAYQRDNSLQIKSVVALERVKGYIYIEAYKQSHVKQAIQNVDLRMGQWKRQMVAIKEMRDVLRLSQTEVGLKQKQWLRSERGSYKDDIARMNFADLTRKMHLKLLSRIDYGSNTLKRKKKRRSPAKPFDFAAVPAIRTSKRNSQIVEETAEGFSTELHVSSKDNSTAHSFTAGDNVEVCQGELMHLQGKILSINGNFITMLPKHEDLKTPLKFQAIELKKYFEVGDHTKVISGRYEGDSGFVIRVLENRIFLFSDLTMHELEILPHDLQLSSDTATGFDSLGQFQYGDFVQLDAQTVGVIVRLQREIFHVLNMHGKIVEVRPQTLQKKKANRHVVSLDSDQQMIQRRDVVKVIDGEHSGLYGEIKHLYRIYAFLYSKLYLDNGIFVCKTRHLRLGGEKYNSTSINLDSQLTSPRISSPMHPIGGKDDDNSGGDRGRGRIGMSRRDREIIGRTIKITRGPYKGNVGIVNDLANTTARVELHTSYQTISVEKKNIMVVDMPDKTGCETCQRTPFWVRQTPLYPGCTPMHDPQTPLYESASRTPRYGGATPLHDGCRMSGTAWDPTVLNTPSRQSELDGYTLDNWYNAIENVECVSQTLDNDCGLSKNLFSPYNTSPSSYHSHEE